MAQSLSVASDKEYPVSSNRESWLEMLSNLPFLAALPDQNRYKTIHSISEIIVKKGARVIKEGGEQRNVYFIVEGAVNIVTYAPSGRFVSFANLKAGQYFGEISAIDGKSRSATVIADQDCRLGILEGETFLELLLNCPKSSLQVMKKLADIIRASDARVMNLTLLGGRQRVCMEILRMSEPDPGDHSKWTVFPMPTQKVIAHRLGVTRETVTRTFKRLSDGEVVKREGRVLRVNDRKRLEQFVLET